MQYHTKTHKTIRKICLYSSYSRLKIHREKSNLAVIFDNESVLFFKFLYELLHHETLSIKGPLIDGTLHHYRHVYKLRIFKMKCPVIFVAISAFLVSANECVEFTQIILYVQGRWKRQRHTERTVRHNEKKKT